MKYRYTIHQEEKAYRGFFKFNRYHVSFEKFAGGFIENVTRECAKKGDIVSVLPYDPTRQTFLMVEQFRIGMVVRQEHPWTLEVVAGFMDVAGETPEQTAKRELAEETGCQAIALYPLIRYYPSPGGSATQNHVFVATVDSSQALEHTGIIEEGEDIRVHKVHLSTMTEKLRKGEINNSTAIIALQQFFMKNQAQELQNNI
ncbi:MAG: ADP-ribose pyrophosphatase [Gammaproteobacteria bacterium]|nr:MAG: ADP-ribose pyrophosphatase [Gammaproteobacteria bacterium]